MKFKVEKAAVMLRDFFGLLPGQTSTEFVKEKNLLSDDEKNEITNLVAAEYASDPAAVKRFGIWTISSE